MKVIGMLGGTGWSSTIGYYRTINELVHQRLGGHHSAKILLKSIDYHDIVSNYGSDHTKVAKLLQEELSGLIALKPDCIMICCNTLHKYYDMIKGDLKLAIPVFHAVDLVAQHIKNKGYEKVLLLATKNTMNDGFFAAKLEQSSIQVVIPNPEEREEMHRIHGQLLQNIVTEDSRNYFAQLIAVRSELDAVILGCTEYPMLVNTGNSVIPIIDPLYLQAESAVNFALNTLA